MANIRKTTVPIKNLPPIVDWLLTNATGEQLGYLNKIASDPSFPLLVRLIGKLKDFNIYQVFNSPVVDGAELLIRRATARGEVAGLDALIYAAQAAKFEMEERRKKK